MAAAMPFVQQRIYNALKADYLSGLFVPGRRLDIQDLADRHSASKTPVREAACILVGERILGHHAESGFMVPDPVSTDIADQQAWHMQMLISIVGGLKVSALRSALLRFDGAVDATGPVGAALLTAEIFISIASASANQRLRDDIRLTNERLHYARIAELTNLPLALAELRTLVKSDVRDLQKSMRRRLESYHMRRIGRLNMTSDSR
ncbi:GntR family transcriptional regulator [Sphingobium sp. EM0848]|uniref:GntR family transcriptional regulator n=1 Tax=Sphingobium sp. EM0848 TaxID=2743473 RepID=UPI00159C3B1F|nr:GntR family transcriptional regulator [Sphingobium sp. EM0848]